MRWERVFADLEAQLEQAERAELDGEVAERTRTERAALDLLERLVPCLGCALVLDVHGAGAVEGVLADVAAEWLLVDRGAEQLLVPIGAVLGVRGLSRAAAGVGAASMARRLGLAHALRGPVRDREPVSLVLRDGTRLAGTLDRVGRDHVDLAEHPADEPRTADAVRGVRTLPFSAIGCVSHR